VLSRFDSGDDKNEQRVNIELLPSETALDSDRFVSSHRFPGGMDAKVVSKLNIDL